MRKDVLGNNAHVRLVCLKVSNCMLHAACQDQRDFIAWIGVLARYPAVLLEARKVREPVMAVPCRFGLSLPRKADPHPTFYSCFSLSPEFQY